MVMVAMERWTLPVARALDDAPARGDTLRIRRQLADGA